MMRNYPRTSELRWAEWSEFALSDDGTAIWTIPAERMKGRKLQKERGDSHLLPLSRQSVAGLRERHKFSGRYRFLFPGIRRPASAPIGSETMNKALKIMGFEGQQTGHGFRGLASTLMNEHGGFRERVIDAQLSHKEKDKVRAAYNHAQYLDERRALLQWWSDFLDEQQKKAVPQG